MRRVCMSGSSNGCSAALSVLDATNRGPSRKALAIVCRTRRHGHWAPAARPCQIRSAPARSLCPSGYQFARLPSADVVHVSSATVARTRSRIASCQFHFREPRADGGHSHAVRHRHSSACARTRRRGRLSLIREPEPRLGSEPPSWLASAIGEAPQRGASLTAQHADAAASQASDLSEPQCESGERPAKSQSLKPVGRSSACRAPLPGHPRWSPRRSVAPPRSRRLGRAGTPCRPPWMHHTAMRAGQTMPLPL
jgi:hypothetical protein